MSIFVSLGMLWEENTEGGFSNQNLLKKKITELIREHSANMLCSWQLIFPHNHFYTLFQGFPGYQAPHHTFKGLL